MANRMRFLSSILFLALAVTSSSLIIGNVKGIVFNPRVQIPLSTAEAFNPSVIEDTSLGRIYLAWQSNIPGQNPDVYLKYYVESSQLWTSDQKIIADPGQDLSPSLVLMSNTTLLVFWSSNRTGNYDIFYRNLDDPSKADNRVTSTPGNDRKPFAIQDKPGKLWVFWERGENGVYDIYYKTLSSGVWSADTSLTNTAQFDITPSAFLAKDGRIWAAYATFERNDYNIYVKTYNGQTWSTPLSLVAGSSDEIAPTLTQSRDGTLWLFWSKELGLPQGAFQTDIYYKTSTDNGATWSAESALTSTDQFEEAPTAIQASDKRLWIFFDSDISGTGYHLYYIRSDPIAAHDVTVNKVQSPTYRRPEVANITTTLLNPGDFVESFQLQLYVNSTFISAKNVTILPGEMLNVTLPYPTSTVTPNCYPTRVVITNLTTEPLGNTFDDTGTGHVVVLAPGDVDRNGVVNIFDAVRLGRAFDSRPGDPNWDPQADLNKNGVVDIFDAVTVGRWFDYRVPLTC